MIRGGLVLLSAVAILVGCRATPPAPGGAADAGPLWGIVATCARAEGEVSVRRSGAAYWEPAFVGTTLRAGDWLRTAPASRCEVALGEGPSLNIEEETVVEIGLLGPGERPRPMLRLEAGSLEAGREPAAAPLAFRAPDGQVVDVSSGAEEPGRYQVSVRGGTLRVVPRLGSARLSVGGKAVRAALGSAAELSAGSWRVIRLPDFPRSSSPAADARMPCLPGIDLRWEAVGAARAYRVQVARDLSFQELEVDRVVRATSFRVRPRLRSGMLAWRVAALFAEGGASEFGFARRVFCSPAKASGGPEVPPGGPGSAAR